MAEVQATIEDTTADQDWSRVAHEDGEFRAEANSVPFVAEAEAAALAELFSSADLCAVCEKGLGAERWGTAAATWRAWAGATPQAQGEAVEGVVVSLDAAHLRPSGILDRLRQGVAPACFGLATLLQNLPDAPALNLGVQMGGGDLEQATGPEADAARADLVGKHPDATVLDDSMAQR